MQSPAETGKLSDDINANRQKNSLEKPMKTDWKNSDNATFYESISLESNVMNSILGGLEAGEELALIQPYLHQAKSIFEIGAGYGRVLNYLIKNNSRAKIYAIERSAKLCQILKERYNNKVCIYQCDLFDFQTDDKYDLILWLFCGISDFTASEQLTILKKLSSYLSKNGILILETFSHTMKPDNALLYEGQNYVIKVEGQTLQGYIPSDDMIKEYAHKLGFKNIKQIPYQTSSESQRMLHVLER